MSRTVVIHFQPNPGEESHVLIGKLRNYGEDVFRFLRDTPWGTIDLGEVDRAQTQFSITNVKASKMRRLIAWIETEALRQYLMVSIEVR
jgi:hypothetical protein